AVDEGAGGPAASRAQHRQVDAIGEREAIDALEHEREIEGELQLDDDRRLNAARRDDVAAADLALDVVPLGRQEPLDGGIQSRLPRPGVAGGAGMGGGALRLAPGGAGT